MPGVQMTNRHVFFWDGWPSQWFASAFRVDGIRYTCAEQFMMAEKARVFGDVEAEGRIMGAQGPREQKAMGRKVRGFGAAVWNTVCRGIVFRGNIAKFLTNSALRADLEATVGLNFVEASPLDRIWGIGLGPEDPRIHDESLWNGTNWLGIALDQVRDHLMTGRGLDDPPWDDAVREQLERRESMAG